MTRCYCASSPANLFYQLIRSFQVRISTTYYPPCSLHKYFDQVCGHLIWRPLAPCLIINQPLICAPTPNLRFQRIKVCGFQLRPHHRGELMIASPAPRTQCITVSNKILKSYLQKGCTPASGPKSEYNSTLLFLQHFPFHQCVTAPNGSIDLRLAKMT